MKKKDDGKLAEGVRMAETLDTLGTKVDELTASVDKRFEDVDKRIEDGFTVVAVQFAEQRAYTEFAYARLEKAMSDRFDRLEGKVGGLDGKVGGLEGKVGGLEGQGDRIDGKVDRIEAKLDQVLALVPVPRRRRRS